MAKFNSTKRGLTTDKEIMEEKQSDVSYSYESFFLTKKVKKVDDIFYLDESESNDVIINGPYYNGKSQYYFSTDKDEKIQKVYFFIERSLIKNI